ncbi:MAG: SusC/RagA family protein [Bacteroidetes bacterium 4572_77]|nr:MAG: SusC/RagA family protein [Bacteroidetes bacterium 4572_77]
MRKLTLLLAMIGFIGLQGVFAQTSVTGTVSDADNGGTLPGVSVLVKGTSIGTVTDMDGKYSLQVPENASALVYSFVGMETQEVAFTGQTTIDVGLNASALKLDEVVVTALGVSREKKSLGYATQEVDGNELNKVSRDNFVNSLSGKVAGVQIKNNTNMGGSSNVIIRGNASLTQNNQALFVIDGIPVDNSNTNNSGQTTGRSGFDYGNAAADINPDDIESINVLKGAAASALYGSRAANGVIMITTKKGKKSADGSTRIGVNINSSVTVGIVDKSTFPEYQTEYGAGYDNSWYTSENPPGFNLTDVNGDGVDELVVPFTEDGSFGGAFNENLNVVQWDYFDPNSENYHKLTPYTNAENGPIEFFDNSLTLKNSVDVSGGTDVSTFRMGYTNLHQTGIMPNSSLDKNTFALSGSYDILDNLKVSASANYYRNSAVGRNSTGYSQNIISSFRQWFQTNVDMLDQKAAYEAQNQNVTWNRKAWNDDSPIYWDNAYFQRNESYQNDNRNRLIGFFQTDWKINDYLALMGRVSIDTYDELQEERKAVGSVAGEFGVGRLDESSGYSRFTRSFVETNYDLKLDFHKDLGENINLNAFIGTNIRRNTIDEVFASTNGGLVVPELYSLANSKNNNLPEEGLFKKGVDGYYLSASLGYKNMAYLDGTFRRDISSTLPTENNAYNYWSLSGSFLFSELVEADWMQLGKVRLNYATVGNDAPYLALYDTYTGNPSYNGNALYSVPSTTNNANLKPEMTGSLEAGFEMVMFHSRLGFDFAYYKTNTKDQIMPVDVSVATGYSSKYFNAGEIQNSGVELALRGTPVKNNKFRWDIVLNFSKNKSEVISLYNENGQKVDNLQLGRLQGGVSINARVGEAYGTIQGTDYEYAPDGQKIVGANGYYTKTATSDQILGDINPDYNMGLNNSFSYNNLSFSFLIDYQQGGSIFSLDQYYGRGTGLYAETSYTNDLGNPVRNTVENGGGLINEGVVEVLDADDNVIGYETNTQRVEASTYRTFGWSTNPNKAFVYDATYLKLREVALTYTMPRSIMDKTFIHGASFSLVGGNLWIISKELPHADPEASQGSGNIQGWQSGVMPSLRTIGFNVKLQF